MWVAASTYPVKKHAIHPMSASHNDRDKVQGREKKKKEEKRQETKPEEEDIHQHVVSAQKTHHGYSYRTPSESYRKNEHETVVAEVVVALSPRHSHLAISSSPPTLKKNHKHHHFFTQLLCLSLKNTH